VTGRLHGQKPRRGGGDGGGSNPWSSSIPDFSITTRAWPPAEPARAGLGCGEGAGVGTASARRGVAVGSYAARSSSTCGVGVFRGLGVSSLCADFDFALFFASDFFLAVFGFGVGVGCRFPFGVGDFFGFGVDAECVSVSSDWSRRFPSLTWAQRRPATNAPNASAVASQMRNRTTATERNRARDAINAYSSDL